MPWSQVRDQLGPILIVVAVAAAALAWSTVRRRRAAARTRPSEGVLPTNEFLRGGRLHESLISSFPG